MQIGKLVGAGAAGLGLVGAGYVGLAGEDDTTRDESGAVVEGGEVGAFRIRVGDCIADSPDGDFESVEAVPCEQEHRSEVFAAFMLPHDDSAKFPGLDVVQTTGDEGCLDRFEGFVGIDYASSVYGIGVVAPTAGSWNEVDDREVLCLISNYDGTLKTGSSAGSRR